VIEFLVAVCEGGARTERDVLSDGRDVISPGGGRRSHQRTGLCHQSTITSLPATHQTRCEAPPVAVQQQVLEERQTHRQTDRRTSLLLKAPSLICGARL